MYDTTIRVALNSSQSVFFTANVVFTDVKPHHHQFPYTLGSVSGVNIVNHILLDFGTQE
jgi:hypothetical protein